MSTRFIESYVHGNRIGVLVEFETVDDFATRTDEFRTLAKDIAMQIAASDPISIDGSELDNVLSMIDRIRLSEESENHLMTQPYIKDPDISVADRINEVSTKLGAPLEIIRFVRFDAGAT